MAELLRLFAVWLAVVSSASVAQALPLRQNAIADDCAVEIERFCPTLSATKELRNQRICLRPYRTSLSRACRRSLALKR